MVQNLLLAGQLVFVLLLYVFVWRVMRGARRDLGSSTRSRGAASLASQESTIVPAATAAAVRRAHGLGEPRLVVDGSDVLRTGVPFTIGGGLSIGRVEANDIVLDEPVVSSKHVRVLPPGTVVDQGSTNGTFVNGTRIVDRAALQPGDMIQIGSTAFRYEVPR